MRQHVEGEVFLGEGGERSVRRRGHVPAPGEPPQPQQHVRRERLKVNKKVFQSEPSTRFSIGVWGTSEQG